MARDRPDKPQDAGGIGTGSGVAGEKMVKMTHVMAERDAQSCLAGQ